MAFRIERDVLIARNTRVEPLREGHVERLRLHLTLIAVVTLSGCHADLTERFDIHPDNTVTVTDRRVFDDQFYQLATTQTKSDDPLGIAASKAAGFVVTQTVDDNGNHVITFTKTIPLNEVAKSMPATGGKSLPFDPAKFEKTEGLFTDTSRLHYIIPAVFPPAADQDTNSSGSPDTTSSETMGEQIGRKLIPTIISAHLDVRTPGKVLDSNGETTSDGFTRWTIDLEKENELNYRVETPNIPHIALAGTLAFAFLALGAFLATRRSSRANLA
jgi:hypothetical protein